MYVDIYGLSIVFFIRRNINTLTLQRSYIEDLPIRTAAVGPTSPQVHIYTTPRTTHHSLYL